MIPPPPPPPRDQKIRSPTATHHASQNSASSFASSAPPPAPSNVYTAPKGSYEPYGEVAVTTTASSSGISHRRSVNEGQTLGNSPGYSYGGGGGGANSNRYAMPPSSYGKPKSPSVGEKRDNFQQQQQKQVQYQYNAASMFALCSTLVSILWWHESPIVIQIFLFVALALYGLDLINSRDTLTVGLWIAALILSVTSGIGTLLLVDDNDAVGNNMILFLLQLGVESMFFCSMVSGVCTC